ncbi:hypothetical protein O181_024238 [Austropuccinia psidii MF-1]|uniref:Uncharacterized protein n=1 Tax=Austropuccinia psidii MF-1 TaxID=1389203 RepID=A0A9Q3GY13_9BASI|nr:hypothetical protein [Austropuccinia psidii MF-1]
MFPSLPSSFKLERCTQNNSLTTSLNNAAILKVFDYGMVLKEPVLVHNRILEDNDQIEISSSSKTQINNRNGLDDCMVLKKPILVYHQRYHDDYIINQYSN